MGSHGGLQDRMGDEGELQGSGPSGPSGPGHRLKVDGRLE